MQSIRELHRDGSPETSDEEDGKGVREIFPQKKFRLRFPRVSLSRVSLLFRRLPLKSFRGVQHRISVEEYYVKMCALTPEPSSAPAPTARNNAGAAPSSSWKSFVLSSRKQEFAPRAPRRESRRIPSSDTGFEPCRMPHVSL